MQASDYFAAEYESRCNTPAARYADGQFFTTDPAIHQEATILGRDEFGRMVSDPEAVHVLIDRTQPRVCCDCGESKVWNTDHARCNQCRHKRRVYMAKWREAHKDDEEYQERKRRHNRISARNRRLREVMA